MGNLSTPDKAIAENLSAIRRQVAEAEAAAGRTPGEVRIMAVTKTMSAQRVNIAIDEGIDLLGENRAQELLAKYDEYNRDNVEIHFIGSLQTNKVRQIVDKVSLIQSVDRLELAKEIDRQCGLKGIATMDVLIEVNIGAEASKSGVSYDEARELLYRVAEFPHLRVKGLMCIPPISDSDKELETYFDGMHKLFVDIQGKKLDNSSMEVLSMGMSGDFPIAIKHGANLIRLGSAIFGKRDV